MIPTRLVVLALAVTPGCFAELSGTGYANLGGHDVNLPSWGVGASVGVFFDYRRKVRVAAASGGEINFISGDGPNDRGILAAGASQVRVDVTVGSVGDSEHLRWRGTAIWLGLPFASYRARGTDEYQDASAVSGTGVFTGLTLDFWNERGAGGFLVSAGANTLYSSSEQWGSVVSVGPSVRLTLTWTPLAALRTLFKSYKFKKRICGQTEIQKSDARGNVYTVTVPETGPDCQ